MKNKINEILYDYSEEAKKYYLNFRKKIKKSLKKYKYLWNNPNNVYMKKITSKINDFGCFTKKQLFNSNNRKVVLGSIGTVLFLVLILLINKSFAIYQNEYNFSILKAKVGDNYSSKFDYTLLIYVEDLNDTGAGSGRYSIKEVIPAIGYAYSGYKCQNGSILTYDETTQNTSVTTDQIEVCSIYFDSTAMADVTLNVMLEENPDSNTYSVTNQIPYFGYKYSHYECDNNSTLQYNQELHNVSITSTNQDTCSIYFKKYPVDLEVKLFVEDSYDSNNYIERLSIPSNKVYELNNSNSECINNNGERIDTTIDYVDGYVEIGSKELAYCSIYLDIKNE